MNREEKRHALKQIKKQQRKQRERFRMRTYDITEKMNFEDNPKIKIKDVELEVIATAEAVLQLIGLSETAEDNFDMMMKAYPLIFSEKDRKKIEKLKLNSHDFGILLNHAMTLAAGGDPDEEEKNE